MKAIQVDELLRFALAAFREHTFDAGDHFWTIKPVAGQRILNTHLILWVRFIFSLV